ncbi:MAG: transcription antitermination factor NusB [Clostridium sp.]|nr:transcription antitermination factor NusB [Clostridium sp.]MCM1547357.1 transcription antitermination factor NusB [Ruminococcus sp.]
MTRREVRECAFIILFEKSFRNDDIDELYEIAEEIGLKVNSGVKQIVSGVLEHDDEISETISGYSEKRAIQRIPKVCLTVLKIAIYESLYDDMTPVNAAINEAVLLTKAYAYKEDIKFVNGLLSSFAKNISGEKNA